MAETKPHMAEFSTSTVGSNITKLINLAKKSLGIGTHSFPFEDEAPCFAILGRGSSELTILNMKGGRGNSVSLSDVKTLDDQCWSLGIVNIDGVVYAVTTRKILEVLRDGKTRTLQEFDYLDGYSEVVVFQKKIYIIQPLGDPNRGPNLLLCFNPVDNSIRKDLPGCEMNYFCSCATDEFMYAIDSSRPPLAKKFDHVLQSWTEITGIQIGIGGVAEAIDHKIYVLGGRDSKKEPTRTVDCYDIKCDAWSKRTEMRASRSGHSSCVFNGRLYALGGVFYKGDSVPYFQNTIEVYDVQSDRWSIVGKFESWGWVTHSCIWPYGSFNPEYKLENLANDVDRAFIGAARFSSIKTQSWIGPFGGKIELSGCIIHFPFRAVPGWQRFTVSVCPGLRSDLISISPRLMCVPSTNFNKLVSVTMDTCMSGATLGSTRNIGLPINMQVNKDIGLDYGDVRQVNLAEDNKAKCQVSNFIGVKCVTESKEGRFHLINQIYVHAGPRVAQLAVVFSRDHFTHAFIEKVLFQRNFVKLCSDQKLQGFFRTEVCLSIECVDATGHFVSAAFPASHFTVDEEFLRDYKHVIYFELKSTASFQCTETNISYRCKAGEEDEQYVPLIIKWPL